MSLDFGRAKAAGIADVLGIGSLTGRIATGYLIDRYYSSGIAGSLLLFTIGTPLPYDEPAQV